MAVSSGERLFLFHTGRARDSISAMSDLRRILQLKRRVGWNYLKSLRGSMFVHLGAFLIVMFGVIGGGFFFFAFIFRFLNNIEVLGPPMMNHLTGMVFTAFFAMLIFSNLVVTLSTAYISREVEFYMALPVRRSSIFFFRLIESTVFSSWAFAVFSLPLVVSFGLAREQPFTFYVMTFALVVPFLAIPAALGAMLTMCLSAMFPARKTFRMALLLGALGVAVAVGMARLITMRPAADASDVNALSDILGMMQVGSTPILPSAWLMNGMLAAQNREWAGFPRGEGYWFWLAILTATGLFALQVCAWLAPRIYYRGWRLAGETASSRRNGNGPQALARVDGVLRALRVPPRVGALISKDVKTFWRDPAQWSQLMILFGLLFIYVANLRSVAGAERGILASAAIWKTLMSFFNIGAGCFVLSILTTRFVYPMLSLEGKQFWAIGLAPIRRETLVWEKYWLCWAACLSLTGGLMIFSNLILGSNRFMFLLSMGAVLLLSFGLTSMSVGLGAAAPNFREDNPARIANGLGGTMNIILSLSYVAATLGLLFWPAFLHATDRTEGAGMIYIVVALSLMLLNGIAIIVPMRIGLKRWREFEF